MVDRILIADSAPALIAYRMYVCMIIYCNITHLSDVCMGLGYRFVSGRARQQIADGDADLHPDSGGWALHHVEQRLENRW